jgi:hypothetical protein
MRDATRVRQGEGWPSTLRVSAGASRTLLASQPKLITSSCEQ